MDIIFFKGLATGLFLSLPFGPVGIYCMEKTLIEGEKEGYVSAMGMVTVDIIYGVLAYLFVNQIDFLIIKYEPFLKILIGVALIWIGYKKFRGNVDIKDISNENKTLLQDYLGTLVISLFNVSSILVIAGLYATLRVRGSTGIETPLKLASGILSGGASLWFLTTFILYNFKKKVTSEVLVKISKYSGLVILIFGVIAIVFAFYK
ncbi:MAG: LysE family transporter [Cetobacterium sp.]|uniref:LysE family translocator n=1 Tax=unclassified Cetobacterium TaxID=2630983 RepID=UPI00163CEE39|nr:LysE family transporter [Cetobacterium sp. 2A]MBC2856742.1 LysE family transporter [Cetobacterium sp. 2A]